MALSRKGKHWYGDSQADIREELLHFSTANKYRTDHYADAVCTCGGTVFRLAVDLDEGAAVRHCTQCENEHPIGDSQDYLEDAELEECWCICDADRFEVTVGVSLYEGSEDVRWLYISCRCVACGLTGCYGEWKNEYIGYRELLSRA